MAELIVSVSGIRGIVGETLTVEVATRYARALADHLGKGLVLIGSDGRPSGAMVKQAVAAGLAAGGCAVADLGVVPTPTMGVAIHAIKAAGGIQVTASHNSAPYNGMKLFGPDGRVIPARAGEAVRQRFQQGEFHHARWNEIQKAPTLRNAVDIHVEKVLQATQRAPIQNARLRVLVDANGGAGGPISLNLLNALGVNAQVQGGYADGDFLHEPEPVRENLIGIGSLVAQAGVHAGFILDPDADRLALFDEKGNFLGEELTLALAAWSRLRVEPGPVVINMSTSMVTEVVAKKFGQPCFRSPVGEANVVDSMLAEKARIGGEGNGGVIDPRIGWVRDPFIGMALILELMAVEGKSLGELAASLPAFHIRKDKTTMELSRLEGWYKKVIAALPNAEIDRRDGLRLAWPGKWIHLRPSNTEPIVRIIAESASAAKSVSLCELCKGLATH